ncbi:MAG: nucleoside deaminase [Pleurocapsa sp. MO_226.B13]|nr:nucleoside deaminase [Pleurocapsa sp. MO_226.B13]
MSQKKHGKPHKRSQHRTIKQTLAELNYDTYQTHCHWIEYAQKLAQTAGDLGEIPVGAAIVDAEGKLIAEAANRKERERDATAHAEILAIRAASKVKQSFYLKDCTLYVTLEPCPMCAGAIIQSRLGLLVYGADEPKTGAIRTVINLPDSYCSNHRLKVLAGIKEESCRRQLQSWFSQRRDSKIVSD